MQLRPAGNFKRWTKGREILCSKGNSNGKNEVSWHPRARGWFHIYLQLKQAQWLPICVVSALRVHPGLGCLWGPLCPLYSRGWRWTGISPGGQQTWESQSCPFSHGWGKAVWSVPLQFLPARPFPLQALWPEIAQGLVRAWEEMPLNSLSFKCKWPRYSYLLKISTALQKEDNI